MARRRASSLRLRLLGLTALGLATALVLAWLVLGGLFQDEVMRQFRQSLMQQLDQLTAKVEFDAQGQPQVDPAGLSDPRWNRPYSGLYWQINDAGQVAQLRSRSLWDSSLGNEADVLADGAVHVHAGIGPQDAPLLMLERMVRPQDHPALQWRLLVAADTQAVQAAVQRFRGVLGLSLLALLGLLLMAAWAQVGLGLAPLRALQRDLVALREGRAQRLEGAAPAELRPLVDGFNAVLERNAQIVQRARQQAGNLAHAVKTPLAVMGQAAQAIVAPTQGPSATGEGLGAGRLQPLPARPSASTDRVELAQLVLEQVELARRQVDWHLARARAAGGQGLPGQRVPLVPVVDGLLRVMDKVYAARGLALRCLPIDPGLAFAGEEQDLQEMLGNLIDNACKWARSEVLVQARLQPGSAPAMLVVTVQDDGPGVAASLREAVLARGMRIDESVPGSGLGLAIVADLVDAYGGTVTLDPAPQSGLQVDIRLPAAT